MANGKSKTEQDFQAEFDAQTMADAAAIRADPDRLRRAQVAADRLTADMDQSAAAARKRAAEMKKLAKAGKAKSRRTTTRGTVGASRGPRRG